MKVHQFFFFLLVTLLPVQLGLHFWPSWAHILGRRIDYLSPTLYATDILIVFIFALWARRKTLPPSKYIFPFLIFATVNIFFARSPAVSAYMWLKAAELSFLGWYIYKTRPSMFLIARVLSVGVIFSSLLAVVQFALQHSLNGILWFAGERTFDVSTPGIARAVIGGREFLRPYATFPHPNVLGGFLAASFPLLISAWRTKKMPLFIAALGIGVVGLLFTFSRSAIIAGAVGITATLGILKKKYRPLFLVPFVFAGVMFLLPLSPGDETIVVRRELNAVAVDLWQRAPLWGAGLGNFLVRLPEQLPTKQIYFLQPVHNIYLLLLSEAGIIGFGLFLWLIIAALKKRSVTPALIGLMILLFLGLIDHYPLTLQSGQLLFILLLSATMAS